MATTMKDVARRAGVDVSTVSLAINNDPRIRTATRERIVGIAQELGYRKNFLARGLRSGRSFTIGAIVGGATAFWGEVLAGAQSVLAQRDYHLLLDYTTPGADSSEMAQIEGLKAKRVDGLLIAPPDDLFRLTETDAAAALEAMAAYRSLRDDHIPFVFFDRFLPGVEADVVAADNVASARTATQYLVNMGHRKIAYLYSPHRMNTAQRERLQGYQLAMTEAGLATLPWMARNARGDRSQEGKEAMCALLSDPAGRDITAVIAATDSTALGALRTLHESGCEVPEDISVIGIGGSRLMEYLRPPVTTVTLPMRELGIQAAHRLFARLEGDTSPYAEIRMPTELVGRASCAPPRDRREGTDGSGGE
jgi:LacI family transcriptional regulator